MPRPRPFLFMTTAPANPAHPHAGDNLALWELYRATRSVAVRNRLVERYWHLVRYYAVGILRKLSANNELDDLISSGVFGLMDAVEAFDMGRGIKFETFSAQRIRGAILDELRRIDWVPRSVRSQGGTVPMLVSIDANRGKTEGPHGTEISRLSDRGAPDPTDIPDPDHAAHVFKTCLAALPQSERRMMEMYYRDGKFMHEIGRTLGCSRSNASYTHARALARLRKNPKIVRLFAA